MVSGAYCNHWPVQVQQEGAACLTFWRLHVSYMAIQEKYVRGAYTYPSFGAEEGDRAALAAPVAGRLFFAGEATNESINPCMQVRGTGWTGGERGGLHGGGWGGLRARAAG